MIYNKIEYKSGDEFGPEHIKFISEIEPHIQPNGIKVRKGKFQCPFCEEIFESDLPSVQKGARKSCGCHKNSKSGVQYKQGDILGNGFIFIKEVKKKGKDRRALFSCPVCEKEFEADISIIKKGSQKSCGCLQHPVKVGKRFGRLTVIAQTSKVSKNNSYIWECKCDCGNIVYVPTDYLTRKYTQSCGCLQKENWKSLQKDITNKRFGKLVAIQPTSKRANGSVVWKCKCDCGNIAYVSQGNLLRGTISCGCVRSKGEQRITEYLQKHNIYYIKEAEFEECINPKTKRALRFDFYLPEHSICIEYNGQQHYIPVEHFGGEKRLISQKENDAIKEQFCENTNKKLFVIRFDEDIDKRLSELLKEF